MGYLVGRLHMETICGIAIVITLLHCLDLHVQALDNGLALTPPMVRLPKLGAIVLILYSSGLHTHRADTCRGGTPGTLFMRTSRRRWFVKAQKS